jgi:hypothetical protein
MLKAIRLRLAVTGTILLLTQLAVAQESPPAPPGEFSAEQIERLRDAAEGGDAQAQFGLGCAYDSKDAAEAVKWYRKAAAQGHDGAQHNLGLMYELGKGVPKDGKKAVEWYLKAAEKDSGSYLNLGSMYSDGKVVPKNSALALKYYRAAAEHGDAAAQWNLGAMYAKGDGVPKNDVLAYMWLNLAGQTLEGARQNRDTIALAMTQEQIAEAQALSQSWRPKGESKPAPPSPSLPPEQGNTLHVATGTGFFVSQDGYVITNYHVVSECQSLKVKTSKGILPAKRIKTDTSNDLALLKIEGTFEALPIGDSEAVKLGDSVFTIGFPNVGVQGVAPKLTKGEINSLAGIADDARFFQTSVQIQPGNSGSPLMDMKGNVVGVVTTKLSDIAAVEQTGSVPQNVNYAVKSSYVKAFLENIPAVAARLPSAIVKPREFREVADRAQKAVVLVMVER